MAVAETLAYYDEATISDEKRCRVQAKAGKKISKLKLHHSEKISLFLTLM
jgi:hypothetical protein